MHWLRWCAMMAGAVFYLGGCAQQAVVAPPAPAPAPALAPPPPPPEPPKWVPPPVYEKTDEEKVRETIVKNESYIRYLYNKHAKITPGIEGKVVVEIAVDEFGNVAGCTISLSTVKNKGLENELLGYLRTLKFDDLTLGDIEVTYPFIFSPTGKPQLPGDEEGGEGY
jgi:TonB family protein